MIFTLLHPLVDFCSVAVLAMGGMNVERWLAYNAFAFALQFPLGLMLDAWPSMAKRIFLASLLLVATGVALEIIGCEGGANGTRVLLEWIALVLVCLGNALFHLSAGKKVLEVHAGESGPAGLFISTGALGLMAGQLAVERGCTWVLVPAVVALAVGTVWQTMRWNHVREDMSESSALPVRSATGVYVPAAMCLFALIVWRSWAGLLAGGMSSDSGFAFVLAGAMVTWAGKTAGGYVADAFGRRGFVTMASVLGSAALCFACSPSNAVLWLVLLFVAQLATGPVLSLMYDAAGRRAGTAFGLNCLGLFTGSLV